jgi:hypothetical protein
MSQLLSVHAKIFLELALFYAFSKNLMKAGEFLEEAQTLRTKEDQESLITLNVEEIAVQIKCYLIPRSRITVVTIAR